VLGTRYRKSIYTTRNIGAYRSLCRRSIMAEKEMRNFAIRDKKGNENGLLNFVSME